MASIIENELGATQLRRGLQRAHLPELKLLCGLRFLNWFDDDSSPSLESYLREFIPALAEAAQKSNPAEFLPDEAESLTRLIELLGKQPTDVILPDDLAALQSLFSAIKESAEPPPEAAPPSNKAAAAALFVEHYPDLDLPPRGRALDLRVDATAISAKADDDDVVVRNPVFEPDDRFLAQARDSIKAARTYLHDRYGLSRDKRYRFDFAVDSTGARFTGDSLGLAFAVGAIAAVQKVEIFRERITINPRAAFSGALSAEGRLAPIDADALKLKIYRAFHSPLQLLVVPREHLTEAWKYASELEKQFANRRLELMGADTLASVATDPRLLPVERSSASAYAARKIFHARRSVWVEVPALLVLIAMLTVLILPPQYLPWFDDNPSFAFANANGNCLDVYNHDSVLIWADTLSCPMSGILRLADIPTSFAAVHDLDGDGSNEVTFVPPIDGDCEDRAWLRCYSSDGKLKFKRFCGLIGKTIYDTVGVLYDPLKHHIEDIDGEPIIITTVAAELPARMHIRFWNAQGDSIGWYINRGHGQLVESIDLDSDQQQELFFACFNNNMGCTALLVLKPDSAFGFSPIREGSNRDPNWPTSGSQLAYILFPVSDVGQVDGELPSGRNQIGPNQIQISDKDHLKVHISESSFNDYSPALIYFLNYDLRCENVVMTDILINRRKQLVAEGKLQPIDDLSAYYDRLRDTVTYWTDSGWVTEGQLREAEGRK